MDERENAFRESVKRVYRHDPEAKSIIDKLSHEAYLVGFEYSMGPSPLRFALDVLVSLRNDPDSLTRGDFYKSFGISIAARPALEDLLAKAEKIHVLPDRDGLPLVREYPITSEAIQEVVEALEDQAWLGRSLRNFWNACSDPQQPQKFAHTLRELQVTTIAGHSLAHTHHLIDSSLPSGSFNFQFFLNKRGVLVCERLWPKPSLAPSTGGDFGKR